MTSVQTEDREGGIRVVTLARPPANAIDEQLIADLGTALERARCDDTVRAVVLTGAGAFFAVDSISQRRGATLTRNAGSTSNTVLCT